VKYDKSKIPRQKSPTRTIFSAEKSLTESTKTIFMVRMGDNIVAGIKDTKIGASTTYNIGTGQIDLNIGESKRFTTMQLTAHEFKHEFQYLKGETDFSQNGLGGGLYMI